MLVYRVEKNGHGPYGNCPGLSGMECNHRPMPWRDGIEEHGNIPYGFERYAFPTLNHILLWFDGADFDRLHKQNFEVATYKVDSDYVVVGKRQLIFHAEHATLLKKVTMYGIFD